MSGAKATHRAERIEVLQAVGGGDHRGWAFVDGVDDLGVVDPAQVHRRDPEIGMPELALYDQQRDTLAGHLDGVSMSQLVGATRRRTPAA